MCVCVGQEPGQGYYQPQGQGQWGPESPPKRAPGPGWGAEQQQSHVSPVYNMGGMGGGGGGGAMPPRMQAISQMHGGGAADEARARSKAVYAAELEAQVRVCKYAITRPEWSFGTPRTGRRFNRGFDRGAPIEC